MSTPKALAPATDLIETLLQDPDSSALFKHLAASALAQFKVVMPPRKNNTRLQMSGDRRS